MQNKGLMTTAAVTLALIAIIIYSNNSYHSWSSINDILNNPTFTGTVAGKEKTIERFTPTGPGFKVYRLHIIGEYINNDDEIIEVNQTFAVSETMFLNYEIGDIISYKQNSEIRIYCEC